MSSVANSEVGYILSQPEYVPPVIPQPVVPPRDPFADFENPSLNIPARDVDDLSPIGNPTSTFVKSFRCGLCGGVYSKRQGVYRNGKWFCTDLECGSDI